MKNLLSRIIILSVLCVFLMGCGQNHANSEKESQMQSEINTETEVSTESEINTEIEVETEIETEILSEIEEESETEVETQTEMEPETEIDSDTEESEMFDVEVEVAQIRKWYYATQEKLDELLRAGHADGVDAYYDGAYAAKVVIPKGYQGDSASKECFFHDKQLYFIYAVDNGNEYRFYFKDGTLIRYIGPDKKTYDYGHDFLNEVKERVDYLYKEATELESTMVNCGA